MHILITGGTGFIGSALVPALLDAGHEITIFTRRPRSDAAGVRYVTDLDAVDGSVDAVINLAGASLAERRWTEAYKRELRDSRIGTTEVLGRWLAKRDQQPQVLLSGSAVGYYGPRDDEALTESSAPGQGFAAELCQDWEAAAQAATPESTRLCVLRIGVVFDRSGGAYEQMALPFRFRFGNWIGDGQQWLSWIHRRDLVAALLFLLEHPELDGAFNLTAPEPVTSRGFCSAMQAVHRSLLSLPVPAAVMRLALGEMADELLISGQRVLPSRLEAAGFGFHFPTLAAALPVLEGKATA